MENEAVFILEPGEMQWFIMETVLELLQGLFRYYFGRVKTITNQEESYYLILIDGLYPITVTITKS